MERTGLGLNSGDLLITETFSSHINVQTGVSCRDTIFEESVRVWGTGPPPAGISSCGFMLSCTLTLLLPMSQHTFLRLFLIEIKKDQMSETGSKTVSSKRATLRWSLRRTPALTSYPGLVDPC